MIRLVKCGKHNILLSFIMVVLIISISITTFAAFSSTATVTGTITFVNPGLEIATDDVGLISFNTPIQAPKTFTYPSGFKQGITIGSDMSEKVVEGATTNSNDINNQLNGEYIEYEFIKADPGIEGSGTDVKYTIKGNANATSVYAGFEFDLFFPNTINYHYVYPAINTATGAFTTKTLKTITLQGLTGPTMVDYVYQTEDDYKETGLNAVLMCVNIEDGGTIQAIQYTKKTYRVYFVSAGNTPFAIDLTSFLDNTIDFYLSDFITGIRCIIGIGNSGQYLPFGGTGSGVGATRTVNTSDKIFLNTKCDISIANSFGDLPTIAQPS